MTLRSGPGASRRVEEPVHEARVDYRLVRDAVIREFRRGRIGAEDVRDAHPELMRAARNVGRPLGDDCPICGVERTVLVTYVFGAGLPAGGRCPGSAAELERLRRRSDPVLCYDVEVCRSCAWHHLLRKYPAGGQGARAGGAGRRERG